ncbi:hypothetical protein ES703_116306 [subsurface metagenome]
MSSPVWLQKIGEDHGVQIDSLESDPFPVENDGVIFDVLSEFSNLRIREDVFEKAKSLLLRELLGSIEVIVTEREIKSLVILYRE